MNLNILKTIGGPVFQRSLLKVSKYAPEILTGVGIASTIASTILIARAATEHVVIKQENLARTNEVKALKDDPEYTSYSKDLTLAYARNSLEYIKKYGPAVGIGVGGIIAIVAAHGIMRRRLVIMTGAYTALQGFVNAYRSRVVEEYGEDKDRDFSLGFRTETIEGEDGKKRKVRTLDPNAVSLYGKWFDEGNKNWRKDPDYNLAFIKNTQNWMNDKLHAQGYLFLCDAYDALGIDRTSQSMIVGWTTDPNDGGDLDVDFNLYDVENHRFINGEERSVFLDFNVQGTILDKI